MFFILELTQYRTVYYYNEHMHIAPLADKNRYDSRALTGVSEDSHRDEGTLVAGVGFGTFIKSQI